MKHKKSSMTVAQQRHTTVFCIFNLYNPRTVSTGKSYCGTWSKRGQSL